MNKQERQIRIIARGEHSNHAHILCGDCEVEQKDGQTLIHLKGENVVLRHLLETDWMTGKETWTQEHLDMPVSDFDLQVQIGQVLGRQGDVALEKVADRTYRYIPQVEYDPYDDVIRQVND